MKKENPNLMAVSTPWRRLVVPALLCCAGIGMVVVGVFADSLGLGETRTQFGSDQKLAVLVGLLILGAGFTLGKAVLGSPAAHRVLLFGGMMLVAVALVEIAGRWLFPIPQRGYGVWAGYPRSELLLKLDPDGFEAVHRYNRFGFRGKDFPIERGNVAYRIACVGDSYTEGIGAAEEATWPAVLGHQLRDLNAQILNLGNAGSGPDRYAQICAQAAFPLRPTDVIVCFNPRDFTVGLDRLPALDSLPEIPDPFYERSAAVSLMARLLPTWMYLADSVRARWPVWEGNYWIKWSDKRFERAVDWLAREDGLSRRKARTVVMQRLKAIEPDVLEAAKNGHFNPGWIQNCLVFPDLPYRVRVEDMQISAKDLEECVDAWVGWFSTHCQKFQIRPWVLHFPQPPQVVDGPFGPYVDAFYRESLKSQSLVGENSFADLFGRSCRKYKVEFIDATDVLIQHNDRRLYLRYDCHPNALAYELVGKLVAEHIRRRSSTGDSHDHR